MEGLVDLEKFESIKSLYGGVASWACWAPQSDMKRAKSGIGDLSIFDPKNTNNAISALHTNFVLVGLNISRDDVSDKPWRNFHSNDKNATDYKIRLMLASTKLWGSYMTDIFKDFPEPKSQKVIEYCAKHPVELQAQVSSFHEEIEFVCENKPILIAFGNVVFQILTENFGDEFKIEKVHHYAYTGVSIDKMRESYINF